MAEALDKLAEQTMASRSAQRTTADIAAVRAQVQAQEAVADGLRQELETVEVRTNAHFVFALWSFQPTVSFVGPKARHLLTPQACLRP